MAEAGPVEEVVHDALVFGDELVEFVHEDDAGDTAGGRVVELPFQQPKRVSGTHALASKGLPK